MSNWFPVLGGLARPTRPARSDFALVGLMVMMALLGMPSRTVRSASEATQLDDPTKDSEQPVVVKAKEAPGLERLGFLLGNWDTTITIPDGPEGPEKRMVGRYEAWRSLKGRLITERVNSVGGDAYEGLGHHSYNAKSGYYRSWYFDTEGVASHYASGRWINDRTLVYSADEKGETPPRVKRSTYKILGPDRFQLLEEEDHLDGKGFVKVLEVDYRRKDAKDVRVGGSDSLSK